MPTQISEKTSGTDDDQVDTWYAHWISAGYDAAEVLIGDYAEFKVSPFPDLSCSQIRKFAFIIDDWTSRLHIS